MLRHFQYKDQHDATDIDYLFRFINEVEEALGKRLLLEQSVDNLCANILLNQSK